MGHLPPIRHWCLEDGFQRLAMDQGQPLSPELLEALLSMACIGALGFLFSINLA